MSKRVLFYVLILLLPIAGFAGKQLSQSSYGPTTSHDRLWDIACAKFGNELVTPQQAMVAILDKNPKAFINNNVNSLLVGKRLLMPSVDEVKQISEAQALARVEQQNREWKRHHKVQRIVVIPNAIEPTVARTNRRTLVLPPPVQQAKAAARPSVEYIARASKKEAPAKITTTIVLPLPQVTQVAKISKSIQQQVIAQKDIQRPFIPNTSASASIKDRTIVAINRAGQIQLAMQFEELIQSAQEFKMQTQSRILGLEQEIAALKLHISRLDSESSQLSKAVDQGIGMTASTGRFQASTETNNFFAFLQSIEKVVGMQTLIILLAMMLLAYTSLAWLRKTRKEKPVAKPSPISTTSVHDDEEDEYDFLGSEEGIPAKLDLARAYVDMDDIDSAREVLMEVIEQGNSSQVQEAESLLSQLKK